MKPLKWWLRIVGSLYLMEGVGYRLRRSSILTRSPRFGLHRNPVSSMSLPCTEYCSRGCPASLPGFCSGR